MVSCGQPGSAVRPDVLPKNVQAESLSAEVVVPGMVLVLNGQNFGTKELPVSVGGKVCRVLGWSETQVVFTVPDTVKTGDKVKVCGLTFETPLTLAPAGSVRVTWTIDLPAANEYLAKAASKYDAGALFLKAPLYLKGQWTKTEGAAGSFDAGWGGGQKVAFAQVSPGKWVYEFVFTPENLATFDGQPMLFAIEDSDDGNRSISGFESDAAAVVKLEWAALDGLKDISSDPGVILKPGADITLSFPVR